MPNQFDEFLPKQNQANQFSEFLDPNYGVEAKKPDERGDFMRSIGNYMPQIKQFSNSIETLSGVGLKKLGFDEFGDRLINDGLEGLKKANTEISSKDSDSFTNAWDKGIGTVVTDWIPYQAGQVVGNLAESGLAAVAGSMIGGAATGAATGGAATPVGVVGGFMGGLLTKTLVKNGTVAAAKQIAEEAGEQAARNYLKKEAGKLAGTTAALSVMATYHGFGETGSRVVEEAQKAGLPLSEIDMGRYAMSAMGHSALELLGDKIMLDGVLGHSTYKAAGDGFGAMAKTVGASMGKIAAKEAPIEIGQTALERTAAGLDLTNKDAQNEYMDAGAAAASFGILGAPSGVRTHYSGKDSSITPHAPNIAPNLPTNPSTDPLAARADGTVGLASELPQADLTQTALPQADLPQTVEPIDNSITTAIDNISSATTIDEAVQKFTESMSSPTDFNFGLNQDSLKNEIALSQRMIQEIGKLRDQTPNLATKEKMQSRIDANETVLKGELTFPTAESAMDFAAKKSLDMEALPTDNGFVLAPKLEAPTAKDIKHDNERIAEINLYLVAQGINEVVPLYDSANPRIRTAQAIAKIFRAKATIVSENNGFDGMAYKGETFIAENTKMPELVVTGHEVMHSMEQQNPQAYTKLVNFITPYLKDNVLESQAQTENDNRIKDAQGNPMGREMPLRGENSAESEVMAILNGEMWLDPKFWREMIQKDKNLFRQVAYYFAEVSTKAIESLSGKRIVLEGYVNNINEVRSIMSQTWADYNSGKLDVKAPAKKVITGAQRQREALKAKNPFLSFLATHGVSILDRSDVGGQGGRAGMKMVAGHGSLFRKTGLRLDELAQLAYEQGFLTKDQFESDNDNGGVNSLSEMIQKALNNEVVAPNIDETNNIGQQMIDEAESMGIKIEGKTSDQIYDELSALHNQENYTTTVDAISELNDIQSNAVKTIELTALSNAIGVTNENVTDQARQENDSENVTRGQDQNVNGNTSTNEDTAITEEKSDSRGFSLESETQEAAKKRIDELEKAQSIASKKEQEIKESERQKRIAKEIQNRQEASADNFQLGQSAEDSLSGQKDIFSNENKVESKQSTKPLSDIEIEVQIDGETEPFKVNAKSVLEIMDAKIKSFENLLGCLKG
jgi:hypothetical protein